MPPDPGGARREHAFVGLSVPAGGKGKNETPIRTKNWTAEPLPKRCEPRLGLVFPLGTICAGSMTTVDPLQVCPESLKIVQFATANAV